MLTRGEKAGQVRGRLFAMRLRILIWLGGRKHKRDPSGYEQEAAQRRDCAKDFRVGEGESVEGPAEHEDARTKEQKRFAVWQMPASQPEQNHRMEEVVG